MIRRSFRSIKSSSQINKELLEENRNIIMISEFSSMYDVATFRCLSPDCNYEWEAKVYDLLANNRQCRRCSGHEILNIDEIDKNLADRNVKRTTEYNGNNCSMTFKCLVDSCSTEWEVKHAYSVIRRNTPTGCPGCFGNAKYSNEIYDKKFLENTNIGRKEDIVNMNTRILFYCKNVGCGSEWVISPNKMKKRIKSSKNKMLCCVDCKKKIKEREYAKRTEKICSQCKTCKPLDAFCNSSDKRHHLDGKCSCCKECEKLYRDSPEIKLQRKESEKKSRISRNKRKRERLKNNPLLRLIANLRRALIRALKDNVKTHSVLEYLLMDPEKFKILMESKFTAEMNWNNTHLDHIMPISYFDHYDEKEIQKCWHWSNFQPLLGTVNCSKQDVLPEDFNRREWQGQETGWIINPS